MRQRVIQVLTYENLWKTAKVVLLIALLLVIVAFIAHIHPGIVGADESFIVQSGSMEPAIPTGSVIFIEEDVTVDEIQEGDVITFRSDSSAGTTTHRVHEKRTATVSGETSYGFVTKGDNNEEPDPDRVFKKDIVGRVTFSVPVIGYIVAFAGTNAGWVTFVVIPITLLMLDGLWTLWRAIEVENS